MMTKGNHKPFIKEGKVVISEKKQDIVIIGAGIAGLVAAIEGAVTGAKGYCPR